MGPINLCYWEAKANKKSNPVVISEDISPGTKDKQIGRREYHWLAAAADEQWKSTATNSLGEEIYL